MILRQIQYCTFLTVIPEEPPIMLQFRSLEEKGKGNNIKPDVFGSVYKQKW